MNVLLLILQGAKGVSEQALSVCLNSSINIARSNMHYVKPITNKTLILKLCNNIYDKL